MSLRRVWPSVTLLVVALASGQPRPQSALLTPAELLQNSTRVLQLMDAASVAIPELARAGAPVAENARQASAALVNRPDSAPLNYTVLTNLRAYLVLSDSVAKPFPFPIEAARQLAELRDLSNRLDFHFRALLDQKELQVRSPDPDNIKRYAEANQKLPPPQPGHPRVVFLGDSITDLWRLNEYFPDRDFINRGISGQITSQMVGRMKADVLDLHPEAALVLAGTNDLGRGIALTTIENNLTMLADLGDYARVRMIFASVLPVSDYHREQTPLRSPVLIHSLNEWLQTFCSQRGYTYVDYFSLMIDQQGMLKSDLSEDGLHPNSAGYRLMAPAALDAIQKNSPAPQQKPHRRRLFPIGKE